MQNVKKPHECLVMIPYTWALESLKVVRNSYYCFHDVGRYLFWWNLQMLIHDEINMYGVTLIKINSQKLVTTVIWIYCTILNQLSCACLKAQKASVINWPWLEPVIIKIVQANWDFCRNNGYPSLWSLKSRFKYTKNVKEPIISSGDVSVWVDILNKCGCWLRIKA